VLASGQVSVSHRQAVVPMLVQYLGRLLNPLSLESRYVMRPHSGR
jgi:hypothetical protein